MALIGEEEPRQVKENWRGEANRIDAIHHARVTDHECAVVGDIAVPFDR